MLRYDFLDPDLIIGSEDFRAVESFVRATGRTEIGWHYIVDLTWIYSRAKDWPTSYRILDAGGGAGPTQFILAEMGFSVTTVDLLLPEPDAALRSRYAATLETLPSRVPTDYVTHLERQYLRGGRARIMNMKTRMKRLPPYRWLKSMVYRASHDAWRRQFGYGDSGVGTLRWVCANLCAMPEIRDRTFDAVVSLSALEHIPRASLQAALGEIKRVSRGEARWAVTTSGTERNAGWFHEPSKGYCFSEGELGSLFGAKPCLATARADAVLEKYRHCGYLKEHLARFYRRSGENGMPWGVWNPTYVPVGLSSGGASGEAGAPR